MIREGRYFCRGFCRYGLVFFIFVGLLGLGKLYLLFVLNGGDRLIDLSAEILFIILVLSRLILLFFSCWKQGGGCHS